MWIIIWKRFNTECLNIGLSLPSSSSYPWRTRIDKKVEVHDCKLAVEVVLLLEWFSKEIVLEGDRVKTLTLNMSFWPFTEIQLSGTLGCQLVWNSLGSLAQERDILLGVRNSYSSLTMVSVWEFLLVKNLSSHWFLEMSVICSDMFCKLLESGNCHSALCSMVLNIIWWWK